jgi:cytochrome P450
MMNDDMNHLLRGNALCSDGDGHRRLRRIVMKPMTATGPDSLKSEIETKAEQLVEARREADVLRNCRTGHRPAGRHRRKRGRAAARGTRANADLGRADVQLLWPVERPRAQRLSGASGDSAFPLLQEMMRYATTQAVRGKLKPGSWAEAIIDAVDRGEVDEAARPVMMIDYMGPSLVTTICAIGSGLWLFAKNPQEWRKVCQAPSLVASAMNEILRLEAPVQGFSRLLTRDYDMDGIALPAGSRAIAFYGAANRDERKFPRPSTFDVRRGWRSSSRSAGDPTSVSASIWHDWRCMPFFAPWPGK